MTVCADQISGPMDLTALLASLAQKVGLGTNDAKADADAAARWLGREIAGTVFSVMARAGFAQDAEDALQTIFIKAIEASSNYRHGATSCASYFRAVARNQTLKWVRLERQRLQREADLKDVLATSSPDNDHQKHGEDFDGEGEAQGCVARLRLALRRLQPRDQELVQLHLKGLRPKAIAEMLGITSEAARQRFHRVRQALSGLLSTPGACCLTDSEPTSEPARSAVV
ncbi:ECF RNA polymerase sigma factor SigE [Gemmata obscuriglobus]|nr:ECF RNA polymerase sigma factor SigE [Gemmata obscuriglobus]VTS05192.1 hypothetical protein : RNA polymerase sigma factor SigE OS=Nocardia brasiliensis ATCC 700358 GN=O3I_035780 PE=4 SV=1: Sigma70_r2: Sigma70_r4_2 [Gemmata obscuriglobus UQM 2246]